MLVSKGHAVTQGHSDLNGLTPTRNHGDSGPEWWWRAVSESVVLLQPEPLRAGPAPHWLPQWESYLWSREN